VGGWVTGGYKLQIRCQAAAEKEKLKWCSELQGVHRLSAGSQALVSKFSCMSTEHIYNIYAPNGGALSTEDYVFFFFFSL
jgi:hypothetical protein